MTDAESKRVLDPTTASIEEGNVARGRLRAEAFRLSKALMAAYTDNEACAADRDRLRAEVDRLKKIDDTMFVEGFVQAVGEIRDHFRKARQTDVVDEIEKIWLKGKSLGGGTGVLS